MSPQLHTSRLERPPRIRSMLTLEVASEIVARAAASAPDAFATCIQLRQQTQDFEAWFATIVSGDSRAALGAVADGRADLAVVGPFDLAAWTAAPALQSIGTLDDCDLVCRADTPGDVVAAFRAAAERFSGKDD